MRAAVLYQANEPLRVEEVSLDEPRAREVRVRIAATGVCHSDLNTARGMSRGTLPVILGHEASGVVDAVGDGTTRVKVGDKVILSWAPNCGQCFYCHESLPTMCDAYSFGAARGGLWDGTTRLRAEAVSDTPVHHFSCVSSFAEYAVVPEAGCIRIDDDIPFAVAALVGCAVTTGFGAVVNDAKVRAGSSVAVIGVGGVGLNAIQAARLSGAASIIAVDVNDTKESVARQFGATHFLNPSDGQAVAATRELTHGRGVDRVIECTGRPVAIELGYDLLRNGGCMVVVGIAGFGETVRLAASTLPNSQKRIVGSNYGGGIPEEDIHRILQLYRAGRLDLDSQVGRRIRLDDVNEAFEWLEKGVLTRTVIEFPFDT